jgi:CheY-specific phosphatase CheX
MAEAIREAACTAVSSVFETMFFISLDFEAIDPVPPPQGEEGMLRGRIGVDGKVAGILTLDLPRPLLSMLTANFLGLEESEVSPAQIEDMAGELTNMVAGNLFANLDKKNVYKLTPPETRWHPVDAEPAPAGTRDTALDFWADGYKVTLILRLRAGDSGRGSDCLG